MIADKIIPSFYIIEVTGDAVKSIIPHDYGIQKISFGSFDFESDLHASAKIDRAVNYVLAGIDIKSTVKVIDEVNPEFLPRKMSVVENEDDAEVLEAVEEMSSQLIHENKVAIAITRSFDALGDFVVSRKQISADNFKIEARTIANIDEYVKAKSVDQFEKFGSPPSVKTQSRKIEIH